MKRKVKDIPVSAGQCPKCGDILVSWSTHDYKECYCKESFIDGGFDYIRCTKDLILLPLYLKRTKASVRIINRSHAAL